MANYISPFTDWGFKRIFGQEYSKDLLISFLNDLLEGEVHIKDVTFKDKELLPESKDLRGCIFDIFCETDEGKHFIVEMQNRWVSSSIAPFAMPVKPSLHNASEKRQRPSKPAIRLCQCMSSVS